MTNASLVHSYPQEHTHTEGIVMKIFKLFSRSDEDTSVRQRLDRLATEPVYARAAAARLSSASRSTAAS